VSEIAKSTRNARRARRGPLTRSCGAKAPSRVQRRVRPHQGRRTYRCAACAPAVNSDTKFDSGTGCRASPNRRRRALSYAPMRPRHGPHRGRLPPLRSTRPRLRRRPRSTAALLHKQLSLESDSRTRRVSSAPAANYEARILFALDAEACSAKAPLLCPTREILDDGCAR